MKDELVGLSELKSDIIKCGDCGKKLVNPILIETNQSRAERGLKQQKIRYKVTKCPHCGGSSFNSDVYEGTSILGPIEGENFVIEMEDYTVDQEGVINMIVSLVK